MSEVATIDSGTDELLVELSEGVATITLNRPERKNALSAAMMSSLGPIVSDLERDPNVGAVVLTGSGTIFSAGGDLKDFNAKGGEGGGAATVDRAAIELQQRQQKEIIGGLRRMTKPVIASLPGAAAGAGLGIALAADLRIGTPRSIMATAFMGVGLSGDFGTSWQLQHLIGRSRAAEMMLLAEKVDAETCLRLGLLNWIVEPVELQSRTTEIAHRLAHGPRLALNYAKQNLNTAESIGLDEAMDREVTLHKLCGITPDHREAVSAFLERRPAVFASTSPDLGIVPRLD